ncbi:MAG: hypothetical protein AB8H86_16345, partial [Polyangiales bacterium]
PEQGCIIRSAYRTWIDDDSFVRGFVSKARFSDLGTWPPYLDAHLQTHDAAAVHPDAEVHPKAKLERTWVGPGAVVGPVTVSDCVVWDGAEVNEPAERTVFGVSHQVRVP